jgi:hypothetical protein
MIRSPGLKTAVTIARLQLPTPQGSLNFPFHFGQQRCYHTVATKSWWESKWTERREHTEGIVSMEAEVLSLSSSDMGPGWPVLWKPSLISTW